MSGLAREFPRSVFHFSTATQALRPPVLVLQSFWASGQVCRDMLDVGVVFSLHRSDPLKVALLVELYSSLLLPPP